MKVIEEIAHFDIAEALTKLPYATFVDTCGTNGWVANPTPLWALSLARLLPLRGLINTVILRMLKAGVGIPPHKDIRFNDHPTVIEHRYHLPLVTHYMVTMHWPEEKFVAHLSAGTLYEVQVYGVEHEIVNLAPIDRIHLVIDTIEVTV